MPVIGNSGAPLEHLSPGTWFTRRLRVLEPTFFVNGAKGGEVRERALGPPTRPLAHRGPRRLAAQGGKGGPYTALSKRHFRSSSREGNRAAKSWWLVMIPVVVNGPFGLPPPRSADVAPVPLAVGLHLRRWAR
jgi:hypothetical protein